MPESPEDLYARVVAQVGEDGRLPMSPVSEWDVFPWEVVDGVLVPGGIAEQTRRALENLEACLDAARCGLGDVLRVGAFLADLGDFEGYNDVYREFFEAPYPARTTVGAALPGGILVEIEAVARKA